MAQGDIIQMMPTGSVHMFPVNSVLAGFLECNGAVVSRTTYAALFAVLGITYGAGDGSTTFGLPDYRGEFLRGWDNGRGVDSGRAIATTQTEDTAPNSLTANTDTDAGHTHALEYNKNSGDQIGSEGYPFDLSSNSANNGAWSWSANSTAYYRAKLGGSHSHVVTVSGSGETRPRNMALMYCIKV